MTQSLARSREPEPVETIEQALVHGDLSALDSEQRVNYYLKLCRSLGLNEFSKPFEYIILNGKLTLYARKDATDQLRKIHKVNITAVESKQMGDLFVVTAAAMTPDGRRDTATGAVSIKGLSGDVLANALMRCETKAKRRVTLSLCGLGMIDESEVDSIAGAKFPPPEEGYIPTRERDVEDADIVRSADHKVWKRYLEVHEQALRLHVEHTPVQLPISLERLKEAGNDLVERVEARKKQIEQEETARITGAAEAARRARDRELDEFEANRQRTHEGLR